MKTIERISSHRIMIDEGDRVTMITLSTVSPLCQIHEAIRTEMGLLETFVDWFGVDRSVCERRYGIQF